MKRSASNLDHFAYYFDEEVDWETGRTKCENANAKLATIANSQELSALRTKLNSGTLKKNLKFF